MASHNGDLDKLFKPFMEWLSKGDLGGGAQQKYIQ